MKIEGGFVYIATFVLLLNLFFLPDVSISESQTVTLESNFTVDVPTWYVNDSWTYDTHLHLTMGLNKTDLYGSTTYKVTSIISERQNGTLYEAYNVSVSGSLTGNGSGEIFGLPFTMQITTATLNGYQWIDRSDLSLIRDNETISAQGTVRILLFTYPLELRFDSTSNRSPSQEDYDFPILSNDTWQYRGNMRSIGYYFYSVTGTPWGDIVSLSPYDHNTTMDFDGRLEDIVDLNIGGNTYRSYHIIEEPPSGSSRQGVAELWYSPKVKNCARQKLIASTIDYVVIGFTNLTSYTLSSHPFALTISLDPQTINPGGTLNVSGTTSSNANVIIFTPWNESSMNTNADSIGGYNFVIQAPDSNDFTPSNADVGSHGILVEVIVGAMTTYNTSTIVLMTPDLSISQSDLNFSQPPTVGIQTTILATVHASPIVGVHSTVVVHFLLNGSFLTADTVTFIMIGGQQTFTALWTPASVNYVIGVRVDPSDVIIEGNEANNYVEIGVTPISPDLVPWNITLSDGSTANYVDPALTGYASLPLEVSLGQDITIDYEIRNCGSADAIGLARIVIVETQGMRGPWSAPPIFDSDVNLSLASNNSLPMSGVIWPAPSSLGIYYLNLTIDADNSIAESAEGNNTFVIRVSVGAPDLTVSVSGPSKVTIGGSANATFISSNIGTRPSPATTVFVSDALSGTPLGSAPTNPIEPGFAAAYNFSLDTLTTNEGQVCLNLTIDPSDNIIELNENNNENHWCFYVTLSPVTSLITNRPRYDGSTQTFISNKTAISFDVVDNSDTGINKTMYRINGGTWIQFTPGTPFYINSQGIHTIHYNSTDNIGGVEETRVSTFYIDNISPITTWDLNESTLTLSASDEGAGVLSTYYRMDDGQFVLYTNPISIPPGNHVIQFYSVDRVQNNETLGELTYSPDDADEIAGGENLKLVLSAIFSVIILIFGFLMWRGNRKRELLLTMAVFVAIEMATGISSLGLDTLAFSPSSGAFLGLFIDIAILIIGLLVLWFLHRRRIVESGSVKESEMS